MPHQGTQGSYKSFWQKGNPRLYDGIRKCAGYKAPVFQHHIPTTDADVLCMAGEGATEPCRKQPHEVYPHAVLLFLLEYRGQLL